VFKATATTFWVLASRRKIVHTLYVDSAPNGSLTVTHRTVWLHPDYGEAVVVWEWTATAEPGYFTWLPIDVQFDLFTTAEEQKFMIYELEACRILGTRIRGCHPPDSLRPDTPPFA